MFLTITSLHLLAINLDSTHTRTYAHREIDHKSREVPEMAMSFLSYDQADEDYIDMEISSFSKFFSLSSPPQTREFEFQMSSSSVEREPTNSPADELFYKGKLLPLHLPPRLQMVEKLLQSLVRLAES